MKQGAAMRKFESWVFWSPWPKPWYRTIFLILGTGTLIQAITMLFVQPDAMFTTILAAIMSSTVLHYVRPPQKRIGRGWPIFSFTAVYVLSFIAPAALIDALFTQKWYAIYVGIPAMSLLAALFVSIKLRSVSPSRQSGTG